MICYRNIDEDFRQSRLSFVGLQHRFSLAGGTGNRLTEEGNLV